MTILDFLAGAPAGDTDRILDPVDALLFTSGELRPSLEHQADKLRELVEAEPEESLKQADAPEWARALAKALRCCLPRASNG